MMNATSTDDARARAAIMLESLEKSISASASAEATQNFQKENMMLKEQIELILRDNIIMKRLVAIQHERQKEHNDDRIQKVQQLKHLIAQYLSRYKLQLHILFLLYQCTINGDVFLITTITRDQNYFCLLIVVPLMQVLFRSLWI
uniref:Uncharacterized protein n=1 Tax=Solanum lycopersicum TaxID=4081 RepID=A0A3Q7GWS8_SOLLC